MCPCMNMKREISEVGNTTIWSCQRCHGWSRNDGTASCLIHPSPIHPSELGKRHLLSRIILPITVGVAGVSHQPFWLIHFKKFCLPVIFELPSGELNGPHTQTIRHFFHKELRKPTEIETCFFRTIRFLLNFPCGNHGFCCFPHLISLAEEWIHDSFFFPTGNVWQHYGSPWGTGGGDISLKTIGIFFYACKASNHEVFSGLGDGWGGSLLVIFWGSGWLGDLQHFFLRQKDGMISRGDLNFQGDKMISCWKEKHQKIEKIILLMIYEALCSVFVILWNDFWSFSSVMFFFWYRYNKCFQKSWYEMPEVSPSAR